MLNFRTLLKMLYIFNANREKEMNKFISARYVVRTRDHGTIELPDGKGIPEVVNGFWVDSEMKFCTSSAIKYWIPPAGIIQVEKVAIQQ